MRRGGENKSVPILGLIPGVKRRECFDTVKVRNIAGRQGQSMRYGDGGNLGIFHRDRFAHVRSCGDNPPVMTSGCRIKGQAPVRQVFMKQCFCLGLQHFFSAPFGQ